MKTIFLIIMIFTSFCLKAQDLEKIKKQNVFFVLFDDSDEYMVKYDLRKSGSSMTPINYSFYYFDPETRQKEEYNFSFYYTKYEDFDSAYEKVNETKIFNIHKSFIRKNKDIIITKEFIDKLGEDKFVRLLYNPFNLIFIIDESEIKGDKITLREVYFSSYDIELNDWNAPLKVINVDVDKN